MSHRLLGIDAARALAIVGMVMVHVGPRGDSATGLGATLYGLTYGRASVLFVVLAGVGVTLLTGDRSPPWVRDARLRLLVRAVLLFPLGLALQSLDTGVAVILQYYAVYFLVAALAVRLPGPWLAGLAAALFVVGPLAIFLSLRAVPAWFDGGGSATIEQPVALARDLLLTGYYPVVTWAPPLLTGMWIGRLDLRASGVGRSLLLGGVVVAAGAYGAAWVLGEVVGPAADPSEPAFLLTAEGHSEMPLSVLGATGVAVAVLGGMLRLAARWPRLTWPLAATGQLALSVYVGHLLVLATAPDLLVRPDPAAAAFTVARFTLVTVALATLWRAFVPRGPLEAAFSAPWALLRQWRAGRAHWDGERGRRQMSIEPGLEPLVARAARDLARRTALRPEEIAAVSAELVTWSDASLGCPQPGMRYAQVPQDGALIRLEAAGRVYRYHTGGNRAEPFLCEQGPRPTPPVRLGAEGRRMPR